MFVYIRFFLLMFVSATLLSEADVAVTKRLSEAGDIMGVQLLDHGIISNSVVYSVIKYKASEDEKS